MRPKTLADRIIKAQDIPNRVDDYEKALKVLTWVQEWLKPRAANALLMEPPPPNVSRFVFDQDPQDVVNPLINAGSLHFKQIVNFSRMPTDQLWMEHTDAMGWATGVFARRNKGNITLTLFLDCPNLPVTPVQALTVPDFPWSNMLSPDHNEEGTLVTNLFSAMRSRVAEQSIDTVAFFSSCLFLLTVPRVCEVKAAMNAPLKVKYTGEDKPPTIYPPIEIRHVKLVVGQGRTRYVNQTQQPGESDESYRRRLHEVIGHFRTYSKNRSEARIAWVPPHWRGDASKGIIIKQYHVQDKPAPKAQDNGELKI